MKQRQQVEDLDACERIGFKRFRETEGRNIQDGKRSLVEGLGHLNAPFAWKSISGISSASWTVSYQKNGNWYDNLSESIGIPQVEACGSVLRIPQIRSEKEKPTNEVSLPLHTKPRSYLVNRELQPYLAEVFPHERTEKRGILIMGWSGMTSSLC